MFSIRFRMVSPSIIPSLICSEFNHFRGESGKCELVPGATILSADTIYEQCDGFTSTWYERTAYRKIPYSSCEGGERPDRGKAHACPGLVGGGGLSGLFWGSIAILPFALAGLAGYWWYHNAGRPGYVYRSFIREVKLIIVLFNLESIGHLAEMELLPVLYRYLLPSLFS